MPQTEPIMTNGGNKVAASGCDIASYVLMAGALVLVLATHMLTALLAGLLVYEMVNVLTRVVHLGRITGHYARVVAVAFLAAAVVAVVSLAILGLVAFFRSEAGSLPVLLTKMAEIIEDSRKIFPAAVMENFPNDAEDLRADASAWLKDHASDLTKLGGTAGRLLTHILIGMIIGAMVSLRGADRAEDDSPLTAALAERVSRLRGAFHDVVFAQIRIAAINAMFTGLYLGALLPLLGISLPFTKTLVAVTFVLGLLPIIGNLISNTVIVVVSLSHSVPVALGSLAFLIVIHKLEYLLNARIVGSHIRARAWEILTAMLVMEAIFGIPGLIAAPIYYAYMKDELKRGKLVCSDG